MTTPSGGVALWLSVGVRDQLDSDRDYSSFPHLNSSLPRFELKGHMAHRVQTFFIDLKVHKDGVPATLDALNNKG